MILITELKSTNFCDRLDSETKCFHFEYKPLLLCMGFVYFCNMIACKPKFTVFSTLYQIEFFSICSSFAE